MTEAAIYELIRLKGNVINRKFIEQYEKEWMKATNRLKQSGADLSGIVLVPVHKQGK